MMSCVLRNSGLSSIKFLCATLSHMSICAWIVVAISFQEVDAAPHTEAGTQGNHQGLKGRNCGLKKCHIVFAGTG